MSALRGFHGISGALALAMGLAGCVETEPSATGDRAPKVASSADGPVNSNDNQAPIISSPPINDCRGEQALRFVGKTADDGTRARLLEAVGPVSAVRWVGPGDATTEDYSPGRLNIMLDAGGVIRAIHCG